MSDSYDQLAQELAHIRIVITQLESRLPDHCAGQVTLVMSPDYWRTRIIHVLQATDLPPDLESQIHSAAPEQSTADPRRLEHDRRNEDAFSGSLTSELLPASLDALDAILILGETP